MNGTRPREFAPLPLGDSSVLYTVYEWSYENDGDHAKLTMERSLFRDLIELPRVSFPHGFCYSIHIELSRRYKVATSNHVFAIDFSDQESIL